MKSRAITCLLDPVPTKLLKEHLADILPLLTYLINISRETGVFSSAWKTAIVKPPLKKDGLELAPKNCRPVSSLQFVSKLVERAVVQHLCQHMDSWFPLPSLQSAYRTGHSTETAMLKVQSDILCNMDNKQITQLVVIDLSVAFDTVDHCLLSTVMPNQYGVSSTALEWIESYLTGRYQQVSVGSSLPDKFSLNHGVPQGSCLGPVMLTQYSEFHLQCHQ